MKGSYSADVRCEEGSHPERAYDPEGGFRPIPTYFEDADALEYVMRDGPNVARQIDESFTLLLDAETREPVGFRLEAPKRSFDGSHPEGSKYWERLARYADLLHTHTPAQALSIVWGGPKWQSGQACAADIRQCLLSLGHHKSPLAEKICEAWRMSAGDRQSDAEASHSVSVRDAVSRARNHFKD